MFDVAASNYDNFMGRYSVELSAQFADFAVVRPGQRVLDVGCGTGALTAELLRRLGAESVAAVDPSSSFVDAVRVRCPGVDVRVARAEELPFEDASFDAALAQLVVHFMSDPVAGVREMARVTRPGGTVSACVWDHAGDRGPVAPFWKAARSIDPDVPDESDLPGVREGHLAEIFEDAGLEDVVSSALTVRRLHSSFDEWWEPYTRSVGPAGVYLAKLDEADKARVREACRALVGAGPVSIEALAWVARGRVS